MTLLDLQRRLEFPSGKKFKLTINDNRSTMLSVKWEPDCTRISMHKNLLSAPQNVMDELACYLQRGDGKMAPEVKSFIERVVQELDYSDETKKKKLYHRGVVYDLKEIYDHLNSEYFNDSLNLYITWFGRVSKVKNKNQVSLGFYQSPLKLIKIHRHLDTEFFPEYVVGYIVYHEMLHEACPPYVDAKGVHRIHNKQFKEREGQYRQFRQAQKWLKDNTAAFFE